MKVTVQRALRAPPGPAPSEKEFRDWAMAIDGGASGGQEVCVRLVDDSEAEELNRRYRQKKYVPNVLAFPFVSPLTESDDYLGDLVMAAHQIVAEAREYNRKAQHHWAHLFVHGVLHLRGYDHQSQSQESRMRRKEIAILRKLNIDSPYDAQTPPRP